MKTKVTVIGAGFSGLTVARELLIRGIRVEVLEKSDRPGGLISTLKTPRGIVETAASSVLRTARVERLFRDLEIDVIEPSKTSRRRYIYTGRLSRWPLSLTETVSACGKFLTAKVRGSHRPRPAETVEAWGRRSLGETAIKNLVGPALQGIYAADHRRLSASLILGPMFHRNREKFKGVISARDGMGSVISALERDIRARGGVIHYGVQDLSEIPKPVVLAVPAPAAADLLMAKNQELARRISSIRMSSVVTATAFFEERSGPQAFGCLVGRDRGLSVLGVLLNHAIFSARQERSSETWIFGGADEPTFVENSDEKLREVLLRERRILFGKDEPPMDLKITRWPRGLPIYDLVLEDILKDLRPPEGVWLHGNWLGGIGLSKILTRSEQLADRIAREIQ